MIRPLGVFYGFSFVTGGILGFVPGVTEHEMFRHLHGEPSP